MGQEQWSPLPVSFFNFLGMLQWVKCVSLEYQPRLITGIHRCWRLLEIDGDQQGPHKICPWEIIVTVLFVRSPKQISVTGIFFSVSIYMIRRCPAFGGVRQFTKGNTKEVKNTKEQHFPDFKSRPIDKLRKQREPIFLILTSGRLKQENQEFKAIVSFIVSSRLAWTT